jgi:hypothetical protein
MIIYEDCFDKIRDRTYTLAALSQLLRSHHDPNRKRIKLSERSAICPMYRDRNELLDPLWKQIDAMSIAL